jgi:hypothetical protein
MSKTKEQFKYTIKQVNDNPQESLIEKEGVWRGKVEFTVSGIKKDMEALKKRKLEVSAKIDLDKAQAKNVTNHYPDIEKMDKKTRIAVFLYEQATTEAEMLEKGLVGINNSLDECVKELEEIKNQTGIQYE